MLSLREKNRRRWPGLRSKTTVVNALKIVWVLAVLWYELGAFFWSVALCRWPKRVGSTSFHVLLVADPQVPRPYTRWIPSITSLKQHIVNHNLRKSWNAAKTLHPQAVVFLGDMLRHGNKIRGMLDYGDYLARFQAIFTLDPSVPTYFIPGNRDVGLGSSRTFSAHARDRFEAYFGPSNQIVSLANHTLVLLDAPALVEEDYRRHGAQIKFSDWLGIGSGSIEFIKSVATTPMDLPVILFTHIPLSRPDSASCGPLREYGNIRRNVGPGYQSLLGRETSKFLLENTAPMVIFSADDQDYCEHQHTLSLENGDTLPVREVTVKSFSMATRLKRPGFQLLSLFNPADLQGGELSYSDTLCLLPNQSKIYTYGYAPLLFGTLFLLLFVNLRRPRSLHLHHKHTWHDSYTSRGHESSSPDPSPIAPSPPVSPIQFKSSHSHAMGLRSASTLSPNPFPSQPLSPLGGNSLLTPSFRPSPEEEDDGAQEILVWPGQTSTPTASPYLDGGPQGVDSSYFLPSPGVHPVIASKKSIWLPRFGPRTRLTRPRRLSALFMPLSFVGHVLLYGGTRRALTWHGRFVQDVLHVSLLPTLVYVAISLWLAR